MDVGTGSNGPRPGDQAADKSATFDQRDDPLCASASRDVREMDSFSSRPRAIRGLGCDWS
jgi:hypothetical protein